MFTKQKLNQWMENIIILSLDKVLFLERITHISKIFRTASLNNKNLLMSLKLTEEKDLPTWRNSSVKALCSICVLVTLRSHSDQSIINYKPPPTQPWPRCTNSYVQTNSGLINGRCLPSGLSHGEHTEVMQQDEEGTPAETAADPGRAHKGHEWFSRTSVHLLAVPLFTWELFIPWQPEASLQGTNYPLSHREESGRRRRRGGRERQQSVDHKHLRPLTSSTLLNVFKIKVLLMMLFVLICRRQLCRNLNGDTPGSFEMSGWRPSPIVLCSVISGLVICWNVHHCTPDMEEEKRKSLAHAQRKHHIVIYSVWFLLTLYSFFILTLCRKTIHIH